MYTIVVGVSVWGDAYQNSVTERTHLVGLRLFLSESSLLFVVVIVVVVVVKTTRLV